MSAQGILLVPGPQSVIATATATSTMSPTGPTAIATPSSGAVILSPGDNVQAAVNASPAGSTFIFTPGVYRGVELTSLKDGNTFSGQPGAILNGSIVVTARAQVGTLWQSSGQPEINSQYGPCQVGFPGCAYPQDLYLNDAMLTHVTSPANLTTGTWDSDYVNDMVWMADDPTGQTVELSVTPQAFVADANNIMIQNLTIEKYASFQQQGAVDVHGNGWIVSNDEIRLNHAEGVRAYALNDRFSPTICMTMANRAAVRVAPPARAMPTWWWKETLSTITISRILLIVSNQEDASSASPTESRPPTTR